MAPLPRFNVFDRFLFQISREESDAKQLALEKEMTKVVAACEEKINALKAEHNQQIQQSKKQTQHLGQGSQTGISRAACGPRQRSK